MTSALPFLECFEVICRASGKNFGSGLGQVCNEGCSVRLLVVREDEARWCLRGRVTQSDGDVY